jgi:tetratricopeptide (TPR) repeat protein
MTDTSALFKRGEEAFQKRNYDYARDLFLNIVTVEPDNEKARKSLYATCLQKNKETGGSGRIRGAIMQGKVSMELAAAKNNVPKKIDIAQKYLCDDPMNSKVRTVLAEALKSQGHWSGCAAESELAVQADPKNIAAAKMLVESLVHLDRVTDAQKLLDKIIVFAQDDRDLMKLQRDLAAKMTMSKGFEDSSKEGGFRSALKDSDRANELERAGHLVVTEADLIAVVERLQADLDAAPTDARIPKKIGDLYYEKKKDYAEAREWYRRASKLAPQDSVLRDKVDDCSLRIFDDEIEAAAKGSDPKLAELKVARVKFFVQSYQRRVADRPTDMGLRFELGKGYYVAGENDKAIHEFQQAVKDPKRKRESHIYLGMAFQKKRLFDMADTQYAKAEEEAGGVLSQATLLSIWYNRALCNREAGKTAEAIAIGKKIMEQDISYRDISALVEKWGANGAP